MGQLWLLIDRSRSVIAPLRLLIAPLWLLTAPYRSLMVPYQGRYASLIAL